MVYIPIVPRMTSDSSPSPFSAFASYASGASKGFHAFDQVTVRGFVGQAPTNGRPMLTINLGKPYLVKQLTGSFTTLTTVSASNNQNTGYVGMGSVSGSGPKPIGSTQAYQFWRFEANSSYVEMSGLQLYEQDDQPNAVVIEDFAVSENEFVLKDITYSFLIRSTHLNAVSYEVILNDQIIASEIGKPSNTRITGTIQRGMMKYDINTLTVRGTSNGAEGSKSLSFMVYFLEPGKKLYSQFTMKFLQGPFNPTQESRRFQQFMFGYMHSKPTSGYIFRFKPYWVMDGRKTEQVKFANRSNKETLIEDVPALSDRDNRRDAIKQDKIEQAVRQRLEALFSRHYIADIEVGTALVLEYVHAEGDSYEGIIDWVEIASRVIDKSNANISHAVLSDLHRVNPTAITIADMMLGYLKRNNKPDAIVYSHTLADKENHHDAHVSDDTPRGEKDLEGLKTDMKLADREIDLRGHIYGSGQTGFRPNIKKNGLIDWVTLAQKTESFGWIAPVARTAEIPIREGHKDDTLRLGSRDILEGTLRNDMSIAETTTKEGAVYDDPVLTDKNLTLQGLSVDQTIFADIEAPEAAVYPPSYVRVDHQKDVGAYVNNEIVKAYGSGIQQARYDLQDVTKVTYGGFDAWDIRGHQFFEGPSSHAKNGRVTTEHFFANAQAEDAWFTEKFDYVDVSPLVGSTPAVDIVRADRTSFVGWQAPGFEKVDSKIHRPGWSPGQDITLVDRTPKGSNISWDATMKLEKMRRDSTVMDFIDPRVSLMPKNVRVLEEASIRVNKIEQTASVLNDILNLSIEDKQSLINEFHQKYAQYNGWDAWIINESVGSVKPEDASSNEAMIYDLDTLQKAEKDAIVTPTASDLLLADKEELNGILLKLVNAAREHNEDAIVLNPSLGERQNDREGDKRELTLSEKSLERLRGIISSGLTADQVEKERPAYIPVERYLLAGDGSDWEDIWGRYSPGLDILDVPDSDYDYAQLQNQTYDPETGVPLKPIGPTNKPEVKVQYPLHHPVPSNADIGLGPVIVDNYIFMDTILAIESLKNRNKLRFAGMPAEKTMRELLAKLFAWIEQAAPNHEEYRRAFRFVRWYSETVVMQLSTHVLHREYTSWLSSIHDNGDLGIPYTATGWQYIPNAGVIQTTDASAELKFKKQNFVDGEFTVRGYFDNRNREGTMEIKVDGVVMSQLTTSDNGAFTLSFELPAGNHDVEIVFNGDSGRISLSSMEITGCNFVGATTVADDSDTNGLKACTTLIQMLLVYFERHHGGGKVKGAMIVKQRGVWNQT